MVMPIIAYGKLKPLRQAKGLNQAEIAAELGISRPTYVLMEQGGKEPTLTQLYTLSRLLGVEPDELCANLPTLESVGADYNKFKTLLSACIAYGATEGAITKAKLSVLVYLVDFAWYHTRSRSITGEVYRCTARGPVADDFFRAVDDLYEAQAVALDPMGAALVIRPIEQFPLQTLTQEELSLAQEICAKWRAQTTESIIEFAREQAPCKAVKSGDPIPYEAILGLPKSALY
jgi:putative transcriptional regulator